MDDSPSLVASSQAPPPGSGGRCQTSVGGSGRSPRVSGGECVTGESGGMEKMADKTRMQVGIMVYVCAEIQFIC